MSQNADKFVMIVSENILSQDTVNQITDIMKNSKCPNESLKNTFPEFDHIVDEKIIYMCAKDKGYCETAILV